MIPWLQRHLGLLDYTVAALARRKGRNAGLLAAYTLIVALLASLLLQGEALRATAEDLLAGAPEVVVQRLTAGRHDLMPAERLDALAGLRGVSRVEGRLWGYHFDAAIGANYTLLVPATDAPAPGTARVGAALARARGLAAGDVLSLRTYAGTPLAFRIAGILDEGGELVSADLMLVSEADFRALFNFPAGHYTDLALAVTNPAEVRRVAQKVLERLPDSRVILREEMRRTYASVFDWRQGLLLAVSVVALMAFALLAWDKAAGLSAEERREIGILKAVGWDSGDVMAMKLWEGLLVSLLAFLLGYVLAWVHVFHFDAAVFRPVLQGWSVLYPQFRLAPRVDVMQVATLFCLTVLPYVAATLVPVWRAATSDPDEVLRA
ncbi:MAG TPA: FtsX-like permease family protein [Thiobacillaceae bacterium]|nr:FtsX-like permease family protein [Thiobacillaceae bacterium]